MTRVSNTFYKRLSFLIPTVCVFNYSMNFFYIKGGWMQDGGWFMYLFTYTTSWPMLNPPSMGGDFIEQHFVPLFFITSFFQTLLRYIGLNIHSSVYYSAIIGAWTGIVSLSAYLLFTDLKEKKRFLFLLCSLIISCLIALNGITFSIIGFSHYEIGIPAFQILFFALYFRDKKKWALLVLILGLMTREDAGFHYFATFFLLSFYFFITTQTIETRQQAILWGKLSLFCFFYSLIYFIFSKIYLENANLLVNLYLGNPVYSHITPEFLETRLSLFYKNKIYIILPIGLTLLFAVLKQNFFLAIGSISVIPWLIINLLAIDNGPGTLFTYYSFPVITAIFWPVLSYQFEKKNLIVRWQHILSCFLIPLIIALSSILPFIFKYRTAQIFDETPWESFTFTYFKHARDTVIGLERFISRNNDRLVYLVDEATQCLRVDSGKPEDRFWGKKLSDEEISRYNTLIYKPKFWGQAEEVKRLIDKGGFIHHCYIGGDGFYAASKLAGLVGCQPALP